jgi:hypothetical protein
MSKMTDHYISLTGVDDIVNSSIHVKPASAESVRTVLAADEDSPDGRSPYVWVRLPNGDLVLGVFPQGDTYFLTENDHA